MTGDAADIAGRLRRLLPPWFGQGPAPVLSALLYGVATVLAGVYALVAYAEKQTRIATATGGWLDLAAFDLFGVRLPRRSAEPDPAYSLRIRREALRRRNTRQAIDDAVFDLIGVHPDIFEGWHAPTNLGYGVAAYGRSGRYGSRRAPFEVIITLPEPSALPTAGPPHLGYGNGGGYGSGNIHYGAGHELPVTNPAILDILAALEQIRAAGVTYYVRFTPANT